MAEWWHDGVHYRTVRTPGGYEMITVIGRTPEARARMSDPVANAAAAASYLRERYGVPTPWEAYVPKINCPCVLVPLDEARASMTVGEFGTIHSITRERYRWWQRPRWAWRLYLNILDWQRNRQ